MFNNNRLEGKKEYIIRKETCNKHVNENEGGYKAEAAIGNKPLCLSNGSGEGSRPRKATKTCHYCQNMVEKC